MATESSEYIPWTSHSNTTVPEQVQKAFPHGIPARAGDTERETAFAKHKTQREGDSEGDLQRRYAEVGETLIQRLASHTHNREELDEEMKKLTEAHELEIRAWERLKRGRQAQDAG